MSVNSIRIDDDVKKDATRIASALGLSFNAVVEILLRQFNRDKGFVQPLRLDDEEKKSYFEMSAEETERAVKKAVRGRDVFDQNSFATMLDEDGRLARYYKDGRVEYVLE